MCVDLSNSRTCDSRARFGFASPVAQRFEKNVHLHIKKERELLFVEVMESVREKVAINTSTEVS